MLPQVIRALMDLCRVGSTSIRKRCVAAIWNMTNVEQAAHGGGSAAESIPMLLVGRVSCGTRFRGAKISYSNQLAVMFLSPRSFERRGRGKRDGQVA